MADDKKNEQNELPPSQQELFRTMLIKEKLRKIQNRLSEPNNENTLKTIKSYAEDNQFIKALKSLKDKK